MVPLLNNKMQLKKNFKELLQIMKTLTTLSTENSLLIYNKLEPVEITLQLQLIQKLSTGEEMILSKKVTLLPEEMTDGLQLITPTGI